MIFESCYEISAFLFLGICNVFGGEGSLTYNSNFGGAGISYSFIGILSSSSKSTEDEEEDEITLIGCCFFHSSLESDQANFSSSC